MPARARSLIPHARTLFPTRLTTHTRNQLANLRSTQGLSSFLPLTHFLYFTIAFLLPFSFFLSVLSFLFISFFLSAQFVDATLSMHPLYTTL
jgi:hypothetical protein